MDVHETRCNGQSADIDLRATASAERDADRSYPAALNRHIRVTPFRSGTIKHRTTTKNHVIRDMTHFLSPQREQRADCQRAA